jgi:hypothetical protein
MVVALAVVSACLGAAAVYLLFERGKSPAQAETVAPVATAPPTVSAAASEAPSSVPVAPEPAPAPLASSAASSSHAASTPSPSRPVPSHRGKPKDTRPGLLPGVLRSAD